MISKRCQTHYECECGYNDLNSFEIDYSHKTLIELGFKRRRDKTTKEVFYLYHKVSEHSADHHHFITD